jgi:hypothetical protein
MAVMVVVIIVVSLSLPHHHRQDSYYGTAERLPTTDQDHTTPHHKIKNPRLKTRINQAAVSVRDLELDSGERGGGM